MFLYAFFTCHHYTTTRLATFYRTTWVSRYQYVYKDKPFWILLKQRWLCGNGILIYASHLHLSPDRQPRTTLSLSFCRSTCYPANRVKALKAEALKAHICPYDFEIWFKLLVVYTKLLLCVSHCLTLIKVFWYKFWLLFNFERTPPVNCLCYSTCYCSSINMLVVLTLLLKNIRLTATNLGVISCEWRLKTLWYG